MGRWGELQKVARGQRPEARANDLEGLALFADVYAGELVYPANSVSAVDDIQRSHFQAAQ